MDLFDLVRRAQSGEAFRTLAAAYGLSEHEVEKAVAAFTPALARGLQQQTADPFGLFELMRQMAAGRFAEYYERPERAATAAGTAEGAAVLERLFRSEPVRRAVSERVAAAAGLAQAVAGEMMPALAAIALGGLGRQAAEANPWFAAMLGQMKAAAPREPAPGPAPAKGPLDRLEEEQAARERQGRTAADNPFAKAYAEWMRAGAAAALDPDNPLSRMMAAMPTAPGGAASAGAPTGETLFGELLDPGRRMGEAYRQAIDAILAGGPRSPAGS